MQKIFYRMCSKYRSDCDMRPIILITFILMMSTILLTLPIKRPDQVYYEQDLYHQKEPANHSMNQIFYVEEHKSNLTKQEVPVKDIQPNKTFKKMLMKRNKTFNKPSSKGNNEIQPNNQTFLTEAKGMNSTRQDVKLTMAAEIGQANKTFKMPFLKGNNIISMSLWGSDERYVNGALKNAEISQSFFPGWKLRIYTIEVTGSQHKRYPPVPHKILDRLKSYGAEIHFINPKKTHIPGMMWRFLVADDLSVDHFIVRDSDSRLSARDAAVVYQWVLSEKAFHCVRDHPNHSNYAVSGGLWGGKPSALKDIFKRPFKEMMRGYNDAYIQDMNFLNRKVWPKVKSNAYCSDSISCDKWPSSHPFPVTKNGPEFLGAVYDGNGEQVHEDAEIILNPMCVPE